MKTKKDLASLRCPLCKGKKPKKSCKTCFGTGWNLLVIPYGASCYDLKEDRTEKDPIRTETCPYWDRCEEIEGENGYCHLLKLGDWEEEEDTLLYNQVKECELND